MKNLKNTLLIGLIISAMFFRTYRATANYNPQDGPTAVPVALLENLSTETPAPSADLETPTPTFTMQAPNVETPTPTIQAPSAESLDPTATLEAPVADDATPTAEEQDSASDLSGPDPSQGHGSLPSRLVIKIDLSNGDPNSEVNAQSAQDEYQVIEYDHTLSRVEMVKAKKAAASIPGVVSVEEDIPMYPDVLPNDPYYSAYQWDLGTAAYGGIDATGAWNLSTGDPSIRVAILDTGYLDHPDLEGRFKGGYDMVSDPVVGGDGNGRDADAHDPGDYINSGTSSWHGTHVAGTIGAIGNNGKGVTGINWNVTIIPVRVLGKGGGYSSDISDGVRWAAGLPVDGLPLNPDPVRVMNLSLGGSGSCPSFLQSAIDAAVASGSIVVVAAGNSNLNLNTNSVVPANCKNVITVGAVDSYGQRSTYSNYGQTVSISAPGDRIASTWNLGTQSMGDYGYGIMSGTSMATPHVTGVISLILSLRPDFTYSDVLSLIRSSAKPFPQGSSCGTSATICGSGILNAHDALAGAVDFVEPTGAPSLSPTVYISPTQKPILTATPAPSKTALPTNVFTPRATETRSPTPAPTNTKTKAPTKAPTFTRTPTNTKTSVPTKTPTFTRTPTNTKTSVPTKAPTFTRTPTKTKTTVPTKAPTFTRNPTKTKTSVPTKAPTLNKMAITPTRRGK